MAIGRENFLFAGSDAGGETLASAMTIIETAKFNGLDPQAYLADIFARIHEHKINRIDDADALELETCRKSGRRSLNGGPYRAVTFYNF